MKKFARTISGVTPLAVMTRPMSCPGNCLYCPTYADAPQSYTPESPAVLRAKRCDYDAREQVALRLRIFTEMGHPTDKIELIIMGGTFLAYPVDYQYQFIKDCYDGLNGVTSKTLEEAKRLNEMATHRCTGLCIETRPDWCGQPEIERMLEFGTTRVELGVQTLSDDVYRLVGRGHGVADVVRATALLREHAFKVYYHWMPGLPGSTPEIDMELSRVLFDDASYRPDGLKLYPTMVVEGTGLERWFREGRYRPYDDDTMVNLTMAIKSIVPKYVRISRVLRDIPSKYIVAGLKDSLRGIVRERMKQEAIECRCIRCREYGHRARDGWEIGEPHMVRMDYDASDGKEIFLSFEDDGETLFGLLRMRIQPRSVPVLGGVTNGNLALIRELHVFGPEVPLSEKRTEAAQHKGLGKELLREAEQIAIDEFKASQMIILSGTGAREYYRTEFGYSLQGDYMAKPLRHQD
jgi:elongator complex protein 3